jgi:type VI secretion system protein VasI
MKPKIAVVALYVMSITLASAQPSDCLSVASDLDRLACYDKEAGRTPQVKSSSSGSWRVSSETSKLTDQTNVYLSVRSKETPTCKWNKSGPADLMLRCMEGKTSLIISPDCHVTSSEYSSYGDVDFRIDQEKSKTIAMTDSTDNRALGLWSGGKSIPIIRSLIGKNTLLVRFTPYAEGPQLLTFDISGLADAIKPLQEACNWATNPAPVAPQALTKPTKGLY